MPITPTDIDNLPSFTAAQLLKLCEWQIAQIQATGQALGQDGRSLTRASLDSLFSQRDKLREEVAAETAGEAGSGNVLVQFGQEQ